jgi:ankyrin repeat protein
MSSAAAGANAPSGADDRVYRAFAAGRGAEEVRRAIELSRSSAAVNQPGRDSETPLRAARRLGRRDLLCLLLENGAEAGEDDLNKAVVWCVEGDLALLTRLLDIGASVDTADQYGWTALIYACSLPRDVTPSHRDVRFFAARRPIRGGP